MKRFAAPALLFAAALAAGAVGLGWDLPSAERTARLLPPGWDRADLFDRLAGGWENIYTQAEGSTPLAAEAAGKYSTRLDGRFGTDFDAPLPPPQLWNSYRSMIIRSRYPDEALPLSDLARMKPAQLDFRPPSFIYGGGYIYPLGAYYLVLSRLGVVEALPLRQALERPGSLGGVYLAGRLLSALAFAGVCLLAFLITGRLSPGLPAYAAYAAVLSAPALGVHARYLTPHLWAAFWALASVYFCMVSLPGLRRGPLLAAGACLGLAAGSYWSAAHALLLAAAVIASAGREALKPASLKNLALAAAAGAAVFLAVNPYLPFNLAEAAGEFTPGGVSAMPSQGNNLFTLLFKVLPSALGPAFALLLPAGCLIGAFSRQPLLRWLSVAVLLFAVPAAHTLTPEFLSGVRRFFPWLVSGVIIGAVVAGQVTRPLRPAARAAVFALLLAPGFVMSSAYALSFADASSSFSTFGRMGSKLDSMPAGLTLGMTEFPQPAYMPHFRLDRWRLRLADENELSSGKELPEYLLVNFFEKGLLAPVLEERYALHEGFYPRRLPGFSPDPVLCPANPPVELYRLKEGA